jgi:TolB protein
VPERIGPDLYWRLFVRCAVQDGSQGEPLRRYPWDFASRLGDEVEAYENGGRLKAAIPSGYYVDFTEIAALYGWQRVPSDPSWRYNWPGILYWQYEKHDGLDWWTAMSEIYSPETLEAAFSGPTPRATATPLPESAPTATTP